MSGFTVHDWGVCFICERSVTDERTGYVLHDDCMMAEAKQHSAEIAALKADIEKLAREIASDADKLAAAEADARVMADAAVSGCLWDGIPENGGVRAAVERWRKK